jgi:ABC-type multidrug transport system ATPase subunit
MFKNLRLENILITDSETTLIDSLSSTIELQSTVLMLADNSFALKSLIKSIGGIYPPNSGRILLDDIDIFSNDRINEDLIKKNISFIFEKGALLSNLSILQNLLLTLDFHFPNEDHNKKIKRINAYLNEFELNINLNDRPSQLNIEQIKLLGFIRGLLSEPEIIIYDEPFRYTDANSKKIIIRKMKELKGNNITQIIKTQFNEDFVKFCNLIYYIINGKLIFSGSLKDFINSQFEFRG